jgi:hypothetical protein
VALFGELHRQWQSDLPERDNGNLHVIPLRIVGRQVDEIQVPLSSD